jgi:predicted nucleotidyltransferase
MNAPDLHRAILRHHMATVEAKIPIKILGILPRGSAAHVFEDNALDLLAEAGPHLSYFDVGQAEVDLSELLGRPVGIVMVSGLSGREAEEFSRLAKPL